jgi:hypothetical protein
MKAKRTLAEAQAIAERKISQYIEALQIIYAKRASALNGSVFDADAVESTIQDYDDSVLYFEQQEDLKRSFCISRDTFHRFTKIRYDGGTRVALKDVMARISKKLRVKSYNDNGTASYKVGQYSKMYIYSYDAFIELCQAWHDTDSYNARFDLKSDYYDKQVKDELSKRFNLKFWDFNKFKFRQNSSNVQGEV